MERTIRVAILEDHQGVIDGYRYRLLQDQGFAIVAVATYGNQLIPMLQQHPADVLLLDIGVPISEDNITPFPALSLIVELRERYPGLKIIVISMYDERTLIESTLKAGVSGYILKGDHAAIRDLGKTIRSIMSGGRYLSGQAADKLLRKTEPSVSLSPRQLQILSLCAADPNLTKAEIANRLHIADSTVRNLLTSAYQRLGVRNLTAAIAAARSQGILTPQFPPSPLPVEFDLADSL
ncbi:MAG: response regulator transcription factor [Anaerolineales bacterium]|nr:response regulator transcription factor [Anaerolineales bacterium]MCB9431477.1 response regulator transcription factor [Ardenticatenaceae bacterium]